ncbi:DUF2778 domain-containing protein [Citrobacter sp. Y3]|nr:DUF2778 domain-containing protein [Citrobacter sp. Y3]
MRESMIYCTLNLREISQDNTLKLRCAGSGVYDVFSGLGHLKNNPDAYMEKNGPIPPGKYWIVDRPTGGIGSILKQKEKEWRTGNNYDEWFALFKNDSLINDKTIVVFKSYIGVGQSDYLNDIRALLVHEPPEQDSVYKKLNISVYQKRALVKNASENFSGINERPFTYNLQERSSFRLHPLRPDGTGVSDGCITFYHREDFNKLRRDLLRANKQKVPGSQLEAYGIITVSDNRYDKY